jgi:ribonuclease HI
MSFRDDELQLYTDGACRRTGQGGWAYVAVEDGREVDRKWDSCEERTTHQRMELQAAIAALSSLPPGASAVVVSDSKYVVRCFQDRWFVRWESNGWKTSSRKPVKNADLWAELIDLVAERDVTFRHVPGHAGHEWNELADKLATGAAGMPHPASHTQR